MRLAIWILVPLVAACPTDGDLPSGTNAPPTEPTVAFSPPGPTSADPLTVTVLVESTDPEGGEVQYDIDWFVENAPRPDLADLWTVPATDTAKGQLWLVQVTPRDLDGGVGPPASVSVTIANSAPTATVSLSPSEPSTDDDLSVTILLDDLDDDLVTGSPTWTLEGNPAPEFDDYQTIAAQETERGQGWAVTVVPFDGEEEGAPASAQVTIANAPPVFGNVALAPTEAFEGDILTVSYDLPTDADGDPLDILHTWFVRGTEVEGETTTSLTSDWFSKTDPVSCSVSASDGVDTVVIDSNEVVVLNSPPTQPALSVSPAAPLPEDDLLCSIDQGSEDADGDQVVETMSWLVDGGPTVYTGVSVPASATADGETWTCEVTPNDGEVDGIAGAASVYVSVGDLDGDGFVDAALGGQDCDDGNAGIYPNAGDTTGDGVDGDCDGVDCGAGWSGPVYFASCPGVFDYVGAHAQCQSLGYDGLATITSATEDSYIDGLGLPTDYHWIGMTDSAVEGVWVWESGLAFVYTDWGANEPSNSGGNEHCGHIFPANHHVVAKALTWNDTICVTTAIGAFVCEQR